MKVSEHGKNIIITTFFSGITISIYFLFVLLKTANIIDWTWTIVHIPMYIQVLSLISSQQSTSVDMSFQLPLSSYQNYQGARDLYMCLLESIGWRL